MGGSRRRPLRTAWASCAAWLLLLLLLRGRLLRGLPGATVPAVRPPGPCNAQRLPGHGVLLLPLALALPLLLTPRLAALTTRSGPGLPLARPRTTSPCCCCTCTCCSTRGPRCTARGRPLPLAPQLHQQRAGRHVQLVLCGQGGGWAQVKERVGGWVSG